MAQSEDEIDLKHEVGPPDPSGATVCAIRLRG